MKIDMHTHCLPVSKCAHHEPELLPQIFKDSGIDAIVLTNHCDPVDCDRLAPTLKEQALAYVDAYHRCKKTGDKIGIKVFFGVEVKLTNEPNQPEFLLYGISEKDFLTSYPLYTISQQKLYEFCLQKDILLVQAHPYRTEQGYAPADMRYLHGIEIYNPHLRFEARYEQSLTLALKNNKIKTAGSDFHIKDQAGLSGMIVPETICDQFALRDYLKQNNAVVFCKDSILYNEQTQGENV